MQTPAACQGTTLLLGMMGFTSIPVTRWAKESVSGSPASSAFERARAQIVTMKDVAAGRQRHIEPRDEMPPRQHTLMQEPSSS
jgi:hypothetical protein